MRKISKFEMTIYASYAFLLLLTIGVILMRCRRA